MEHLLRELYFISFHIFVQVQTSEQTFLNLLILGISSKKFYSICYALSKK